MIRKLRTDAAAILLRDVLDAHGLSQKELAALTGMHPSELSRLLQPGSNPTVGRLASCLWALDRRLVFRVASIHDPAGTGWRNVATVGVACELPDLDLLMGA